MFTCPATDDFFRARIDQMIDLRHPLAVLASRMPWQEIEAGVAHRFATHSHVKRGIGLVNQHIVKINPFLCVIFRGARKATLGCGLYRPDGYRNRRDVKWVVHDNGCI